MPEIAESPPTALQAKISQVTSAAVVDTSFDAGFDAEVEAAIAKDNAAAEPQIKAAEKVEAPKPTKADKADAKGIIDIPDVLLGKKAEAKAEAVEAEREKAIKEQTAGMSQKAADRFRAIEAKAHAAEQKAARAEKLEAQLAEVQEKLKGAIDTTAADAMKKQLEEFSELLDKNAITEHPRFKAKFDIPLAKEIATAAKLAPKEAASEVEALLSLPDTAQRNRRLNEIAGELDQLEQKKFLNAIDAADRLSTERAGEVANWKVNKTRLAEVTEAEKAQAVGHQKATTEKALNSVIARFTDEEKGVELFRKVEGNTEWNAKVDERLESVKKLTRGDVSKEDFAEIAAWAVGSQEYRKMFFTQRALLVRLQEEIASLKSGEPDLGAGGAGGGDDDESGSMVDIIARMAVKAGALR